jgi:putative ABC transport system permease protein
VPGNIPRLTDNGGTHAALNLMDWRIAAFAIGVSLFTGVLFGLFPALKISNPDLNITLREASNRSGTGMKQNRARAVLVITEVALALVLLVGSALLIRTFVGLRSVDPGFDPHNVITMQTSMAGGSYSTTAKVSNFTVQVLRRIESLPGVQSAATSIMLPVEGGIDLPFTIAGRPVKEGNAFEGDEQWRCISPHYFSTFKIPLLRGRVFNENDVENSARVVIVNQALAKKYWPKEDPIGKVITIGKGIGPQFEEPSRQVVGVVATVKETGLGDGDVGVMYIPQSQVAQGITTLANSVIPLSWAVKTAMDPMTLNAAIQREFQAVDSAMPVARVRTMEQVMAEGTSRQNFNMMLLTIFAGIALLLAAIGIYGLISYSVEQRMQEIGIRMALGAGRSAMLRMVIGQGMKLTLAGVVVGLGIAYGLTRLLASLLFGVKASDPMTFAVVAAILVSVALLACFIPARRATKIDPVIALRYE